MESELAEKWKRKLSQVAYICLYLEGAEGTDDAGARMALFQLKAWLNAVEGMLTPVARHKE